MTNVSVVIGASVHMNTGLQIKQMLNYNKSSVQINHCLIILQKLRLTQILSKSLQIFYSTSVNIVFISLFLAQ